MPEALYDAIFKRKSIRNYDSSPIDSSRLKEISEKLGSLKPLVSEIRTEFKIISPEQVTRKTGNKAPTLLQHSLNQKTPVN